ncbi:Uncharacterized protein Fot_41422 [Forsythia ovata]|uniref:Uncharacterized protein n=1 Tax=Forsythia ovata TaxID=205694 RepID=A0ABD1RI95_9LAMI
MDLGTIKSILAKDLYPSPVKFAIDVRLTFDDETFKYFVEVHNEDIHRGQRKSIYDVEFSVGNLMSCNEDIQNENEISGSKMGVGGDISPFFCNEVLLMAVLGGDDCGCRWRR